MGRPVNNETDPEEERWQPRGLVYGPLWDRDRRPSSLTDLKQGLGVIKSRGQHRWVLRRKQLG